MKINFKIGLFLLGLIIIVLAKDDQVTKITITTVEDEIEEDPPKEEEEIKPKPSPAKK